MSKETWMWLASGLGYGATNSGELLAAFPGGAEAIDEALGSEALDDILTQKQAEKLASSRPADFALTLSRAEALGVTALPFSDPDYPDILRTIHNPPPILFAKGDLTLLNGQLSVGIVGARRPSAYGVEAVKAVGRGVALGGAIIVSGLAAGLDAEAHKAALAVNGPTIACIAFGHDTCYPASNHKLMEVIEKYGVVISEYPVGTAPEKPFFLQRNRLIAGLSHALVVAEARRYSGTMSTVNFATDFGRDVFAVPGSIFSELSGGTNAMIREGAYVAASATDILSLYGIALSGEDPVAAASKQAAEGRPLAADAGPSWQQATNQSAARGRESAGRASNNSRPVDYGEMTLGEVLQNAAGRQPEGERVSSRQAIDAFRQIQRDMPPTDDSEIDARNRALDEMVMAVNDSVEIGARSEPQPKQKPRPKPKEPEERVKPFNWGAVEHISKKDVQAEPKPARRRNVAVPLRTTPPGLDAIEPISAVEAVMPVMPVMPVSPIEPVSATNEMYGVMSERQPVQRKREEKKQADAPASAAQRSAPPPPKPRDNSLAGKLRTLQPSEGASKPAARPPATEAAQPAAVSTADIKFDATQTVEGDQLDSLGDAAKLAYEQLGAKPVTLAKICADSGLTSGEAMAALTELELAGLSRQLAGRQFVIVQ